MPRCGHCSRATANASCMTSSARSKLPRRPIRVARIRPDSSRNMRSISIRLPVAHRLAGWTGARLGPIAFDNWSYLDGAEARRRDAGRHCDGIVEILGLNHVKATKLLLGFGKGTVGDHPLLVPHANRGRCGNRLELLAGFEVPALRDALGQFPVFLVYVGLVCLGELVPVGFGVVDQ